ncbi:lipid IV(A) 4-amino-4-deoxy-L-arabinosyltransferase [Shewanella surugensis]|uniref:Lipid IV(A) 4-amino-4-deoxy-L-arabinosyltransferase n=1 Tax=Shewanella surugensis TaxID=212020 RepID=A0ABT0LGU6_9GAMM|nr:lipid IV(A) 4-amino-4-deoxy-L-arabinosyltransferase [Shewanella surugensis]MCL1126928.1 lipid IV(A) 4-amino-4-deoxy-L-arabinosyltransferase [Shewanella surugensis]
MMQNPIVTNVVNLVLPRINLAFAIPLFFIVLYILPLGLRELWSPDELRHAEIAREMVQSSDWIVPRFNNIRYFEKPIMGHWMNASAQVLFGENNFSVRAASALSTLGTALCLFLLVNHFANRKHALVTIAIFLSLFLVTNLGTYSLVDSMLNFWLTAAFCGFYFATQSKSFNARLLYYTLAGFFCALALLTKGFLALALPVIVILPFMLWQQQFMQILRWGGWVIFIAIITSLPWALAIHQAEPGFWHYFFWVEHIQRFSANEAQHHAPVWYYLPYLLLASLPWLFLAPSAFKHLHNQWTQPLVRFALLWALLPFLFFSAANGKLVTYILPCMPPLAILLGFGLIRAIKKNTPGLILGSKLNAGFFCLLPIVILILYYANLLPVTAEEYHRPWLLALVCFYWAGLALIATKTSHLDSQISCYMFMPAGLFLLSWAIIPTISSDSKMPAQFMSQISPLVNDNTLLIADNPDTMSAFNWYFKRQDVYLSHTKGELAYGLNYEEAQHRYIEPLALTEFITEQQQTAPVAFFSRSRTQPVGLPKPNKKIHKGRYSLFYYEKLPTL